MERLWALAFEDLNSDICFTTGKTNDPQANG